MRGRLIIAAACCAGVVAAPAPIAQATSPGATLSMGAPVAPNTHVATVATLTAVPARPTVGQPVRLVVAAPPGARGFAWDLGGGAFARHTGTRAQTETGFSAPGVHAVAVRFTVAGRTGLAALTLSVAPRATPRGPRATPRAPRAPQARRHRAATTGVAGRVTAHVAGDPGVTVADFHFSPATTTIHVGDTITWTNDGPSSHTATAHGGSFDTGVLKKGQSASHTFTQPGTITYFCQIHPFMHGTIVVLAAATTTTTTSAATTPAATTPTATTAATPTGPTLPTTGFNDLAALGTGLLLVCLGAGLRRSARVRLWGRPPDESGRPR